MCVCVFVCVYICMYSCIHLCSHLYIDVCISVYIHVCFLTDTLNIHKGTCVFSPRNIDDIYH